jgi:hypothetical protein
MGRITSRLQSETLGLNVMRDAYSTTPSMSRAVTPRSSKRGASLTIFSNYCASS